MFQISGSVSYASLVVLVALVFVAKCVALAKRYVQAKDPAKLRVWDEGAEVLHVLLVTTVAIGASNAQATLLGQLLVAGAWALCLNVVLFLFRGLFIMGVKSLRDRVLGYSFEPGAVPSRAGGDLFSGG